MGLRNKMLRKKGILTAENVMNFIDNSICMLRTDGIKNEDIIIAMPRYVKIKLERNYVGKLEPTLVGSTLKKFKVVPHGTDRVAVFINNPKEGQNKRLIKTLQFNVHEISAL